MKEEILKFVHSGSSNIRTLTELKTHFKIDRHDREANIKLRAMIRKLLEDETLMQVMYDNEYHYRRRQD